MRRAARTLIVAMALVAGAGCAGLSAPGADPAPLQAARATATASLRDCALRIDAHDRAVASAGVGDGGAARPAGLPYLRVDRFLASYIDELGSRPALRDEWLRQSRALDRQARAYESANLAGSDAAAIERCAEQLFAAEAPVLDAAMLADRARVPDDYDIGGRIAGLYPLVALPFAAGVRGWEREARAQFAAPPTFDRTYWPLGAEGRAVEGAPVAPVALAARPRDALGRLVLDDAQRRGLLAAYAPVWAVQVAGPADLPGAVRIDPVRGPVVDTASPDVYATIAWTRLGGRVLPQLVYQAWFDERPARGSLDLLAGRLDSVIVRITIDEDGAPLMLDTIHGCGCYHMFVPSPRLRLRPPPAPFVEWAFVPASLPALARGARLQVRLEAATHYVVGIDAVMASRPDGATAAGAANATGGVAVVAGASNNATGYRLVDMDDLRSLPAPAGGRRSLFDANGIARGTERAERWLFWPMGIASPGAMRQWGRHATAFIGRRHFDDPRLLDERFEAADAR